MAWKTEEMPRLTPHHAPLRFGIFLPPMHKTGVNPTLALHRDLELMVHLDQLGYAEAWIGEHHSAGSELIASPEVFIAAAAERTKHMKLGTGVNSLPYHHPFILADRIDGLNLKHVIEHLRARAARRLPKFVLEYLEGGCNSEINLRRNTDEIREVRLMPRYLGEFGGADLKTELFGETYEAPFGVSPIGLQGMVWPRSTEILAAAGRPDDGTIKDAVNLNNLDDWATFHAAEIK